jgi:hypothetical protein
MLMFVHEDGSAVSRRTGELNKLTCSKSAVSLALCQLAASYSSQWAHRDKATVWGQEYNILYTDKSAGRSQPQMGALCKVCHRTELGLSL